MQIRVLGDPHVTEDSIEELQDVFLEITKDSDNEKEYLVILGDFYEKKRPTPKELYFGTRTMAFFKSKFKEVILLTGNHAELEKNFSNVDYLKFLNIIVCDEYEITNQKETPGIFFGHFMTNESLMHYGHYDKDRTLSQLVKYRFVFLGHQHSFQKLKDNVFHLGSCRYVTFAEVGDKAKFYCKIDGEKYDFIELKSPVPMKEVFSINELRNINTKTKVLITYTDFNQYKNEVQELTKIKDKFYQFKIKLNLKEMPGIDKQENADYETIFNSFLNNLKDKEIKQILKEHFDAAKANYIT